MSNPVNPATGPQLSVVPPVAAQDQVQISSDAWPVADIGSAKSADASAPVDADASHGKTSAPIAADLRLIIEESDKGHYVYTVVDRRTGDVVSQLPREEVLRMKDQPDYKAGDLYQGDV